MYIVQCTQSHCCRGFVKAQLCSGLDKPVWSDTLCLRELIQTSHLQMSFSTLKFPPCQLASAIECEGVARLSGRSLKLEESSDVVNLSLGRSFKYTNDTSGQLSSSILGANKIFKLCSVYQFFAHAASLVWLLPLTSLRAPSIPCKRLAFFKPGDSLTLS